MSAILAYIWHLGETPVDTHEAGGEGAVDEDAIDPETAALIATLEQNKALNTKKGDIKRTGNHKTDLGHALVQHLGCLHCHGLGGRQGIPNPNAVRKYVPSWDSQEFINRYPVDDGVRYVITNGRMPKKDPNATSSPLPMPPWGNRLKPKELDAIVDYIWSLRDTSVESHDKGGRGAEE